MYIIDAGFLDGDKAVHMFQETRTKTQSCRIGIDIYSSTPARANDKYYVYNQRSWEQGCRRRTIP